jgi:hypothetical protein
MVATRVAREDHPDLLNQRRYCRALREAVVLAMAGPQPPPPPPTPSPSTG